ncbi:hypothetical protein PR048_015318 [Dryococelus australis]|uniref:Transposase n=1 Tax=Dryococelus australis TaxID=614101 RepID=A0ABQ9HGR0_9NEOP|nr:hypothetical protein PR048_015318 [Dryococelus australis]
MMALDFQPYAVVENKGLKQICASFDPRYNLPSATTFPRWLIPALFEEEISSLKSDLRSDIREGIHSLALTTDMWTSWSGEYNARNIVRAISKSGYEHILCFAHLLQLAINDAKKGLAVNDVLAAARKNELIHMVVTRSNTEYHMLSRLLEQKQFVMADLVENGRDGLTAKEWKMAEGVVQVRQPINDAILEMGVNRIPTLSMVIPILHGIEKHEKDLGIHKMSKEPLEVMKHDTHHAQNASIEVELKAAASSNTHTSSEATISRTENPLQW